MALTQDLLNLLADVPVGSQGHYRSKSTLWSMHTQSWFCSDAQKRTCDTHKLFFSALQSNKPRFFPWERKFPSSTSLSTWVALLYMKDAEDKTISQETQTLDIQEKREVNLYLQSADRPFLWKPGEGFCEA